MTSLLLRPTSGVDKKGTIQVNGAEVSGQGDTMVTYMYRFLLLNTYNTDNVLSLYHITLYQYNNYYDSIIVHAHRMDTTLFKHAMYKCIVCACMYVYNFM